MKKPYEKYTIAVPRFNEENGFYTTPQRSKMMSKIRGKETKPEVALRKALWGLGLRYRKNVKKLPGSPDILFRKYKLAIFVDGEFWHGHNWEAKKLKLKTNREFWIAKIERNMQRDQENEQKLKAMGFTVMRFWEKEVKKKLDRCVDKIVQHIQTLHQI
jgi:DNA mismatch endonuclease (patch repair protein)